MTPDYELVRIQPDYWAYVTFDGGTLDRVCLRVTAKDLQDRLEYCVPLPYEPVYDDPSAMLFNFTYAIYRLRYDLYRGWVYDFKGNR